MVEFLALDCPGANLMTIASFCVPGLSGRSRRGLLRGDFFILVLLPSQDNNRNPHFNTNSLILGVGKPDDCRHAQLSNVGMPCTAYTFPHNMHI
jgi:hypothetical protein